MSIMHGMYNVKITVASAYLVILLHISNYS